MTDNQLLQLLKQLEFVKLGDAVWEVQRRVNRDSGSELTTNSIIVKTTKGLAHRPIGTHGGTVEEELSLLLKSEGIDLVSFYLSLWATSLERLSGMQVLMLARSVEGGAQRSPVEPKRWRVM